MLVSAKDIYPAAVKGNFAIPSANFFGRISAKAHTETAEELGFPLFLSYAESHAEFISLEEAADLGKFYGSRANAPIVLHLDHGMSLATVEKAIDLGFTSVMIDASTHVLDENIKITKEVVDYAHSKGVCVEAEIGHVGTGLSESDTSKYTSVEEAVQMVKATNLDSLAVSIGTAHGTYKGKPVINFERLHELRDALPVPLVLHGGSSSGDDNLERCSTEGIHKLNIYTDFVLAANAALAARPSEGYYADRKASFEAIKATLKHYYGVFHTAKI